MNNRSSLPSLTLSWPALDLRLSAPVWALVWLALVACAFVVRGLLPIDETRYLSVAWEMWLRGDFLVPYLNGVPYSDKPPLLFWLFQLGWGVFGVNEWWPRLVPPLVTLASLFVARTLARRLWPERSETAELVPWILTGSALWAVFTTATMFDMLLVFFTLIALHGLLWVEQDRLWPGWGLFGLAVGLGILAKGPVMLLHVAFPALLAPWWSGSARRHPWRWYPALGGALLLAAGVALAWALAAAARGGPDYAQAILWHQTADRMVSSFAHRRGWWWYLPLLPLLLFPWLLWPPLWRALSGLRWAGDAGVRLCLIWLVPTFLTFSLLSGKQVHYLLPLFPAFALLAARALQEFRPLAGRYAQALVMLVLLLAGVALALAPLIPARHGRADWLTDLNPLGGIALVLLALFLLRPWRSLAAAVPALALATVMALVVAQIDVFRAGWPAYDITPAARRIAALQAQGIPVAHLGAYHGQYQFAGRLKRPLEVLDRVELPKWLEAHPQGRVILYRRNPIEGPGPEYVQPYRGRQLQLWSSAALRERDLDSLD